MGGIFAGSDLVCHMDADMDAHLVDDLYGHLCGRNRKNPPQSLKNPCIDRVSARFDWISDMDAHMDGGNRTNPPQNLKIPCVYRVSAGFDLGGDQASDQASDLVECT